MLMYFKVSLDEFFFLQMNMVKAHLLDTGKLYLSLYYSAGNQNITVSVPDPPDSVPDHRNSGPTRPVPQQGFDPCPICLETMEDEEEEIVRCCFHSFHVICLRRWKNESVSGSCPICRSSLSD